MLLNWGLRIKRRAPMNYDIPVMHTALVESAIPVTEILVTLMHVLAAPFKEQ